MGVRCKTVSVSVKDNVRDTEGRELVSVKPGGPLGVGVPLGLGVGGDHVGVGEGGLWVVEAKTKDPLEVGVKVAVGI